MDDSKSIEFNFNKMLLKATSLVVIGAFLFNTVFIDWAWAKSSSHLRPTMNSEHRSDKERLEKALGAQSVPKIKSVSGRVDERKLGLLYNLALMNNCVLHVIPRNKPVLNGKPFRVEERGMKGLSYRTIRIASDLTAEEYRKLTETINPELKDRPIEEILAEEGLKSLEQLEGATSRKLGINMPETLERVKDKLKSAKDNPDEEERADAEAKALSILQRALEKFPSMEYKGIVLRDQVSPRRVLHQLKTVCSEKTIVALSLLNSMVSSLDYSGLRLYAASVFENYLGKSGEHVCMIARLSNGQAYLLDANYPDASGLIRNLKLPEDIKDGYEIEVEQPKQPISRFHRKLQLMQPVTYLQGLVHINLGGVYRRQDKLEEVEECCLIAIDINPRDAGANFNLGVLYQSQGKLKEAEKWYLKAIDINPRDAEAHLNLGVLYQSQGKEEEAKRHFQEFLNSPDSDKYPDQRKEIEAFLKPLPSTPSGSPAAMLSRASGEYKSVEQFAKGLDIAPETALRDLMVLEQAGLLERRGKGLTAQFRIPLKLFEDRVELARAYLNDLFNKGNPKNKGNIRKYWFGEGRKKLVNALRENFVETKEVDVEQVKSKYDQDAQLALQIISEILSLGKKLSDESSKSYMITINRLKTTKVQRKVVKEQTQIIQEKSGIKIDVEGTNKEKGPTYLFECQDKDGQLIGKVAINLQAHRYSLDRTLAILTIGLAASAVPEGLTDRGAYAELIKYINDEYKLLDLLEEELIKENATARELIEILHGHSINIILPPVKKPSDFKKKKEFELQQEALRSV